jgi:hypothetical protein
MAGQPASAAGKKIAGMTDVFAPELWTPRKRWPHPRIAEHLLANPDVCPSILAANLGYSESWIRMVQRKLGIRKLTSPSKYRKPAK